MKLNPDIREIKPPTPTCHAPAIERWAGGTALAWFGGTMEGADDSAVYVMPDMAGEQVIKLAVAGLPAWNPVLIEYQDRLLLFYRLGRFCDCWQTMVAEIKWHSQGVCSVSPSQFLPAGIIGPVKCRPVEHIGCLVCGASVETAMRWSAYVETLLRTKAGAWECWRSRPIEMGKRPADKAARGLIQPAVWQDAAGIWHALMRCDGMDGRAWHASSDLLEDWSPALPTDIRNPNSGLSVTVVDGQAWLAHNDSAIYRRPLRVVPLAEIPGDRPGTDCVRAIGPGIVVDPGPVIAPAGGTTEVSYPYLAPGRQGGLLLAYTYMRQRIRVATLDVE